VRLREPFVFFVDRSLGGRVVAQALREAGEEVRVHDDHFAQDTDDEVWLADVGERGWVVLTKDVLIRRDSLQRRVLLAANVAAFMFARGDVSGGVMAAAFAMALPRMKRALRRFDLPLIASVTVGGDVTLVYDAAGRATPPKPVK
jgi:predicted nuclease of predicted toxin-antitoxin system